MARKLAFAITGTVLAAAALAGGSVLLDGTSKAALILYETAPVSEGEIQKVVATTGVVRPRVTVQVGSELSGRIKSIDSYFNAIVKEGDLLATIDPKTFESKLKQARADLLAAEAALGSAGAAAKKAKSILVNADRVSQRQKLLDQKGITSNALLDNAERDANVARAEVEAAQANLDAAQALVAQKKALLDQATIDLERTQIRAPIAGVVLHRAVDVGQTVAASFQAPELFRLAGDLTSIHIEAQVGEADIGAIQRDQAVSFEVDAHPGRRFAGKVEQIRLSPSSADSVVTYIVIIEASNDKLVLFPGMTANVRVETARRDGVLRVPTEAIRFKPSKATRGNGGGELAMLDRAKAMILKLTQKEAAPVVAEPERVTPKSDGADATIERWKRRLGLDEVQLEHLRGAIKNAEQPAAASTKPAKLASRSGGRTAKSGDEGPSALEKAIEGVLRPDQMEKWAKARAEREGTQRASVWVISKDGTPEKRSVRVGLADVKLTELVSKELKPGDEVIVRSRKAKIQ